MIGGVDEMVGDVILYIKKLIKPVVGTAGIIALIVFIVRRLKND